MTRKERARGRMETEELFSAGERLFRIVITRGELLSFRMLIKMRDGLAEEFA